MPRKNIKVKIRGYTVIETMVAVSIFSIIATAGISALLRANVVHQKSQDMRSLIDSFSFIMEDVSRNIRTSYNYRCITNGNYSSNLSVPQSCSFGAGIAFEHGDFGDTGIDTDQWLYKVDSTDGVNFNISKSVDGGANWSQLNPPELVLSTASGFSVLGAEPPPGNTQQPLVTIKLVGTITYKAGTANSVVSPFSLETAVSQRYVDLE